MGAPELFEWRGYTKPRLGVASCKRMPYPIVSEVAGIEISR